MNHFTLHHTTGRGLLLLLLLLLTHVTGKGQDVQVGAVTFKALKRDFAGTDMGYRKADISSGAAGGKALVIYLHGGSSCGTDNVTQMQEPGIDSIATYLHRQQIPAVMLVPQCSDRSRGWGGMAGNVKALLDFTVRTEGIDTTRIYIFGGSMGGTGTWKMLSTYPRYFAAGMPCAANHKGMSAEAVATRPVYNVMGLADKIMNEQVRAIAQDFITQLRALGDEAEYETVEGWTHETTCIQSYSAARLGWVFAHSRSQASGIGGAPACQEASGAWYTLQGMRLERPASPGLYIHAGRKVLVML